MAKARRYALSIRQPWAALLVHGLKCVEVRAWATQRRGLILIHAARIPDPRPAAWALVPCHLQADADLRGGFIGSAILTDCVAFRTPAEFRAAQKLHLNDPSWFRPPILFGFAFSEPKRLAFRRYPGWMRFFPVEEARA